jgi:hypothetical protein
MPTIETTILDTMNYLQALNRTLINAPAVASYPTVLDTPNLPMAITWPGAGDWWLKGGGWGQSNRTYRVIVFIQVLNQDDIPSRSVDSANLLGRFLNLYLIPGTPHWQIHCRSSSRCRVRRTASTIPIMAWCRRSVRRASVCGL